MQRVISYFVLVFALFAANASFAIEKPENLLEKVTAEMLKALKAHDREIQNNPNKIVGIIEHILVPHVDIYDMSRWVVGRNAWLQANSTQKNQFAAQFKDLMIRTYASSLRAYSNQVIVYKSVQGDVSTKSRVQVESQILESGRAPINVSYRLVRKGETWKVYDIIIEGVSLLKGFKSQFSQDIQKGGLDIVINKMKTHNLKPML